MTLYGSTPLNNPLLDSLSYLARNQLQLKLVERGVVLLETGEIPHYVYFPAGCVVSLMHAMQDGSVAEVAVVGNEGLVGVETFLSDGISPRRAVVHCGGPAYRLRVDFLRAEVERNDSLQHGLLRYTHALMTQMAQTAACNRHHTVDQQLCRWLLLSLDRSHAHQIVMTQEMIANMLGVRREGVTEAACRLQKRGVIAYARGRIEILDRELLQWSSCECYDVIRRSSERMLEISPAFFSRREALHPQPRMVA